MSKPGKVLKGLCKKMGVRLTVKRGQKRVYKSVAVLKRQCANKKKKKVVKRKRRFGTQGALESRNASKKLFKKLGIPDELERDMLLSSHMTLPREIDQSIRQRPILRNRQEEARIQAGIAAMREAARQAERERAHQARLAAVRDRSPVPVTEDDVERWRQRRLATRLAAMREADRQAERERAHQARLAAVRDRSPVPVTEDDVEGVLQRRRAARQQRAVNLLRDSNSRVDWNIYPHHIGMGLAGLGGVGYLTHKFIKKQRKKRKKLTRFSKKKKRKKVVKKKKKVKKSKRRK